MFQDSGSMKISRFKPYFLLYLPSSSHQPNRPIKKQYILLKKGKWVLTFKINEKNQKKKSCYRVKNDENFKIQCFNPLLFLQSLPVFDININNRPSKWKRKKKQHSRLIKISTFASLFSFFSSFYHHPNRANQNQF